MVLYFYDVYHGIFRCNVACPKYHDNAIVLCWFCCHHIFFLYPGTKIRADNADY